MKEINSDRFTERSAHIKNGAMIRGARGLLGWSAQTLAQRAHVGTATVQRIENSKDVMCGRCRTIDKIERALVEAGVCFTEGSAGEIGVQIELPSEGDEGFATCGDSDA